MSNTPNRHRGRDSTGVATAGESYRHRKYRKKNNSCSGGKNGPIKSAFTRHLLLRQRFLTRITPIGDLGSDNHARNLRFRREADAGTLAPPIHLGIGRFGCGNYSLEFSAGNCKGIGTIRGGCRSRAISTMSRTCWRLSSSNSVCQLGLFP